MITLSELQTFVRDFIPSYDAGKITRASNLVIRRIYRALGLTARSTLTTKAPYTTGTLAVTAGSATVTLTGGTFTTAMDGQEIQILGSDEWFIFTYVSSSEGTLSSEWPAADDADATFTLAYSRVDLPANIQTLLTVRHRGKLLSSRPLGDAEENDFSSGRGSTGQPGTWRLDEASTASVMRIRLSPPPDARYVLSFFGRRRPTAMSASGDFSGLQDAFDDAILAGTLAYVWDQDDKQDRSAVWRREFADAMKSAMAAVNDGNDGPLLGMNEVPPDYFREGSVSESA